MGGHRFFRLEAIAIRLVASAVSKKYSHEANALGTESPNAEMAQDGTRGTAVDSVDFRDSQELCQRRLQLGQELLLSSDGLTHFGSSFLEDSERP